MKDYIGSALNNAFLYCYHQDCSNAAMQTSEVRFRPLTLELALANQNYFNGETTSFQKQVILSNM